MNERLTVPSSDVAFTPAVKAQQSARGSRGTYARMEEGGGWNTTVTEDLRDYLAEQTSFMLATVNAVGQPYVQHRGGPPGFLRVLSDTLLGFADYAGNRQYITLGNLTENPRVHLLLIDYGRRRRIKIWGTASVIEGDPALLEQLKSEGYRGRPERAILIQINAWDTNCRQHIPHLIPAEAAARAISERDARIAELERRLETLKSERAFELG